MNTTNTLRKPRTITLAAAALIGATATFTSTNNAFATEDINIGVGELQECTISKSMDSASPKLTQFAINGTSAGERKYDYTRTVQSGDTAIQPIAEVSGLKLEQDVIEGGNVEFEWKVEEGES